MPYSTRPLDARRRVAALSRIAEEADLTPVGEAFKRINNILSKNAEAVSEGATFSANTATEPAEQELGELAADIRRSMTSQLEQGDYHSALSHLLRLQQPLDTFFTDVMVMHEDPALRANRLALLSGLWQTFESVADVSRIHIERS